MEKTEKIYKLEFGTFSAFGGEFVSDFDIRISNFLFCASDL